jgi:hypothetical protein
MNFHCAMCVSECGKRVSKASFELCKISEDEGPRLAKIGIMGIGILTR